MTLSSSKTCFLSSGVFDLRSKLQVINHIDRKSCRCRKSEFSLFGEERNRSSLKQHKSIWDVHEHETRTATSITTFPFLFHVLIRLLIQVNRKRAIFPCFRFRSCSSCFNLAALRANYPIYHFTKSVPPRCKMCVSSMWIVTFSLAFEISTFDSAKLFSH